MKHFVWLRSILEAPKLWSQNKKNRCRCSLLPATPSVSLIHSNSCPGGLFHGGSIGVRFQATFRCCGDQVLFWGDNLCHGIIPESKVNVQKQNEMDCGLSVGDWNDRHYHPSRSEDWMPSFFPSWSHFFQQSLYWLWKGTGGWGRGRVILLSTCDARV